ncbi:hypothetical protein, partial [Idiomarina sp.]|uniref:hypothetical protein n=1 Tax=Idiomarina sp. TaxID=1874361 RepID=UPI00259049A4
VYTNDYHVDQVVYYYTKYKGEEVITHILFLVPEENLSKEVIYEQLVEKYGFGNAELIDKDKIKIWRFNDVLKHNLEVGDGSYVISPVLLGN